MFITIFRDIILANLVDLCYLVAEIFYDKCLSRNLVTLFLYSWKVWNFCQIVFILNEIRNKLLLLQFCSVLLHFFLIFLLFWLLAAILVGYRNQPKWRLHILLPKKLKIKSFISLELNILWASNLPKMCNFVRILWR